MELFPTSTSYSLKPVGCPTVQLNSDTMLAERVSDPTVPQDSPYPLLQMPVTRAGLSPAHLTNQLETGG